MAKQLAHYDLAIYVKELADFNPLRDLVNDAVVRVGVVTTAGNVRNWLHTLFSRVEEPPRTRAVQQGKGLSPQ